MMKFGFFLLVYALSSSFWFYNGAKLGFKNRAYLESSILTRTLLHHLEKQNAER